MITNLYDDGNLSVHILIQLSSSYLTSSDSKYECSVGLSWPCTFPIQLFLGIKNPSFGIDSKNITWSLYDGIRQVIIDTTVTIYRWNAKHLIDEQKIVWVKMI